MEHPMNQKQNENERGGNHGKKQNKKNAIFVVHPQSDGKRFLGRFGLGRLTHGERSIHRGDGERAQVWRHDPARS